MFRLSRAFAEIYLFQPGALVSPLALSRSRAYSALLADLNERPVPRPNNFDYLKNATSLAKGQIAGLAASYIFNLQLESDTQVDVLCSHHVDFVLCKL